MVRRMRNKTHKNPQKEIVSYLRKKIVNDYYVVYYTRTRIRYNTPALCVCVCVFTQNLGTSKFSAHFLSSFSKVFPHKIELPTSDGVDFTSACSENETQAVCLFGMWTFAFIVCRKVSKNK